jgi:hypothetical protein
MLTISGHSGQRPEEALDIDVAVLWVNPCRTMCERDGEESGLTELCLDPCSVTGE